MKSVKDFLNKHNLTLKGATIIVGVSGGPDSMALLHVLHTLCGRSANVIAAHVDHRFRGAESEEDMRFVQAYCKAEQLVCETAQINVTAYAQEKDSISRLQHAIAATSFLRKSCRSTKRTIWLLRIMVMTR